MSCSNVYDVTQCHGEPEEDNYEAYANNDATRLAIHVGKRPFVGLGEAVYRSMAGDIFRSQKAELEFLLDNYMVELSHYFFHFQQKIKNLKKSCLLGSTV